MLSMNFNEVSIMRLFAKKGLHFVATVVLAAIAMVLISCQDNSVGGDYTKSLELTGVEYQSPDSSGTPDELRPGDRIVLKGQNMNSIANLYFLGFEAEFNPALASEENLVVTVPSDLPFGELNLEELDSLPSIRVTNQSSEATYSDLPVLPRAPDLQEMSNEHAEPGSEVTLYGQYLYLVEEIVLPGEVALGRDDVEYEPDGSSITFTLPEGVDTSINGNISITTVAGTADSDPAFLFHGYRNVLLDMLNGSGPIAEPVHGGPQIEKWDYWAAIHPYSGDIYQDSGEDHVEGAEGDFVIVEQAGRDEIGSENNAWYNSYRSINLTNSEWVSPENLNESAGNFAVKFEMAIHGEWSTGTFQILLPETNYAARVEPWRNEDGSNTPVSYEGWRTFTVPLDEFGEDGGSGGSTNDLQALLGSDGVANYGPEGNAPSFRFINDTEGALPAGVSFAIDKVRVTRIAEAE
jgi:hypothetical protein